jgi:branched-chain amino acid transport system permease protein
MRDNENAAQAIGVALLRNKIIAMMISAALTSIMGTAYARYSGFVDPYQFAAPHVTVEVVLFATIGGLGTVLGPLVGAGFLVVFGEIVRGQLGGALPGLHFFIDGVLIIVVILLMPRGVVPKIAEWWDRRHAAVAENSKVIAETATRT